jgi:hypothetical protein
MSGSIGGYFNGGNGGNGAILTLWVDVVPNSDYTLQVGAGGQGQTQSTVPPTNGQATTLGGPGGVFYSAGGGTAPSGTTPGAVGTTIPAQIWAITSGSYLYGIGGNGGDPVAPNPSGANGTSGMILIEWVD